MVWSSNGEKSPDLVGFNLAFFKACWDIVKGDLLRFVIDFFVKTSLPRVVVTSFLALIPKVDNPQSLEEYLFSWMGESI